MKNPDEIINSLRDLVDATVLSVRSAIDAAYWAGHRAGVEAAKKEAPKQETQTQ